MVKRYDFEVNDDTEVAEVVERGNGDYVTFDDYDDLMSDFSQLKEEVQKAFEILRDAK